MLEVAKLRIHRGGSQLWLRRDILRGLGITEEVGQTVTLLIELRPGGFAILKKPSDMHDDVTIGGV